MAKIRALIIVIAVALVTACSSGSTATGIGVVNFGGVWVFFLVPTLYQKSQLELRARV